MRNKIRALKKEGKLHEAYALTDDYIKKYPEQPCYIIEMAWVLYAFLCEAVESGKTENVLKITQKFLRLKIKNDRMIHNVFAWKLIKYGFALLKENKASCSKLYQITEVIKKVRFERPSDIHSAFLNLIYQADNKKINWLNLIEWWGWVNFRNEDFKKFEQHGKKLLSLAEKVIAKTSKQIIQQFSDSHEMDVERVKDYIMQLEKLQKDHPEFLFVPYYIARLKLIANDSGPLLPGFLCFARKKKSEFWVWDLMARFPELNQHQKLTCFAKALMCGAKDDFLAKTRIRIIPLLVEAGYTNEALFELNKVKNIYRRNDWQVPPIIEKYQREKWFTNTKERIDIKGLYKGLLSNANSLLFNDVPVTVSIINGIDNKKKRAFFLAEKFVKGSFNYEKAGLLPEEGDIVGLRLKKRGEGDDIFWQVLSVEETEDVPSESIYRKVEGVITIRPGSTYGFIEGCYVPDKLISNHKLKSDMSVGVVVIASYNKKKDKWGWKAIKISNEPMVTPLK